MALLILVLNGGSSTLKASLIQEGVDEPVWSETAGWREDRGATVDAVLAALAQHDVHAVAHRVVHGGRRFAQPVVIDDGVVADIEAMTDLAPLHNSVALDVIRLTRTRLPDVPHVACFDSAFHATIPEVAWRYPVPYEWAEDWGIRRFGFHGLSVEWSVWKSAEILDRPPEVLSIVVAHLGSGCSVTAVRGGRSTWTSMGFTPLEGLMMGTRSGSIDPGVVLHVTRGGRGSFDDVAEALERRSGLLGVSGVSADMRDVRTAADDGNERAALALRMFTARAAEGISAAMTWVEPEAIVFTGGIGEHDERIRSEILERLPALAEPPRHLTIRAREDVVMSRATAALLRMM